MTRRYTRSINILTRELRRNQTPHEKLVWEALRGKRLNWLKFHRQYPVPILHNGLQKVFVADFYCHEKRLVIEIDGAVHESCQEKDRVRDELMKLSGIKTLRFSNDEVENFLSNILQTIGKA